MQLKDISMSYFIALCIGLSVYFMKYMQISYDLILLMQIIVGIAVFFILCKLTNSVEYNELKNILTKSIRRK